MNEPRHTWTGNSHIIMHIIKLFKMIISLLNNYQLVTCAEIFLDFFYSYNISEETGLTNESLLLGHVSIILDMVLKISSLYNCLALRNIKAITKLDRVDIILIIFH